MWYEYNLRTGIVSEAQTQANADLYGVIQTKLIEKENCLYAQENSLKMAKIEFKKRIRMMLKDAGAMISQSQYEKYSFEEIADMVKKFYEK